MRKTIDIIGIPVDNVTMEAAMTRVKNFLSEDCAHAIYTPNSEIMMAAHREPEVKEILKGADMLIADGFGLVLASRILGNKLPEKVAGIDLSKKLFSYGSQHNLKFYIYGGKPGIAEEAAANIHKAYPGVEIAGITHGYITEDEQNSLKTKINESGADALLVALGAPKQEKWIHSNKGDLKVKLCIGVGGSMDVFAGRAQLAPEFFRRHGLEWLYRLYKEPSRFRRMLDLPRFMLLVMAVKLHLKKI